MSLRLQVLAALVAATRCYDFSTATIQLDATLSEDPINLKTGESWDASLVAPVPVQVCPAPPTRRPAPTLWSPARPLSTPAQMMIGATSTTAAVSAVEMPVVEGKDEGKGENTASDRRPRL